MNKTLLLAIFVLIFEATIASSGSDDSDDGDSECVSHLQCVPRENCDHYQRSLEEIHNTEDVNKVGMINSKFLVETTLYFLENGNIFKSKITGMQ